MNFSTDLAKEHLFSNCLKLQWQWTSSIYDQSSKLCPLKSPHSYMIKIQALAAPTTLNLCFNSVHPPINSLHPPLSLPALPFWLLCPLLPLLPLGRSCKASSYLVKGQAVYTSSRAGGAECRMAKRQRWGVDIQVGELKQRQHSRTEAWGLGLRAAARTNVVKLCGHMMMFFLMFILLSNGNSIPIRVVKWGLSI